MKKLNPKYIIFIALIMVVILTAYLALNQKNNHQPNLQNSASKNSNSLLPSTNQPPPNNANAISLPIDNALSRVTKKPFGLKVSPSNSPVSPEKFSGYHTGIDFETLPDEQNINVPIYAICDGPLILKKYASGYGGVAVQSCQINGIDVTVIYGHLKLTSISTELNKPIGHGQQIGILGKGFSTETDGERKHLHLGIHKDKDINLLGYVQTTAALNGWIDALTILK